jgi:hypothetical protein
MVRPLHWDVYCGERQARFEMAYNDRCFEGKTIPYLLNQCEYSKMVRKLGLRDMSVTSLQGLMPG